MTNLSKITADSKRVSIRVINHMAYFSSYGQMGNITNIKTAKTINIVIPFLDSVVSNLNEAYFLSGWLMSTGSSFLGYLIFMSSGRL